MRTIPTIELFAGIGGFRLGLQQANESLRQKAFEVIWSNQWEPSTKTQHANKVYEARFGAAGHVGQDISEVPTEEIPDHDLLVGGFPCQDYSVATTLRNSKGLVGKKGVLWWQIHRILMEKQKKPQYLLLENVDRLLKSPSKQRGRDFALMLASLSDLGYAVEWRVINAADYGMPQRRRRVFILGYHRDSPLHAKLKASDREAWLTADGPIGRAFPAGRKKPGTSSFTLEGNLKELSDNFNLEGSLSPFLNAGTVTDREVYSLETAPDYQGGHATLGEVLVEETEVPEEFFIDKVSLEKWKYLKGSKSEIKTNREGIQYKYGEGAMVFPDPTDRPSRTIITSEGGATPSRFKHVVETESGRLRRLMPLELERLSMFPDNHTLAEGISDGKRAFFIGNALVVGIVERLGIALAKADSGEK